MIDNNDFDIPGSLEADATSAYKEFLDFHESIKAIPLKSLTKGNVLTSYNDINTISQLFINRVKNSGSLFRKNQSASEKICLIWQSKVQLEASQTLIFDQVPAFKGITAREMSDLSKLSCNPKNIVDLPKVLKQHGIILIYQNSFPGMKLDGSVCLNATGNPIIGLSFRYSRLDYFWFTLMHELAHILLHYSILEDPILDNLDAETAEDIEIHANRVAKYSLVDRISWRNCKAKYTRQENDLIDYANLIGVHPAVVAGLLQKELGDFTLFRPIVDQIDIRELVFKNV